MPGLRREVQLESSAFIKYAIEYGVLTPVDVWSKNPKDEDPAIIIACGGTYHAPDRLNHIWDRITERSHLILVNGGGHRLDAVSPANRCRNYVPFILDQIDEALTIMSERLGCPVTRIDVFFDYPCGVAENHNLSAKYSFQTAIHVKEFLKQRYPTLKVALEFYLDNAVQVLGPDHPLVIEHPSAPAFTFHFSSKATTDYIGIFEREHASTLTA